MIKITCTVCPHLIKSHSEVVGCLDCPCKYVLKDGATVNPDGKYNKEVSPMKALALGLLLLASQSYAAFAPATDTLATMPSQLVDIRTRTAQIVAARAAAGYFYASVDMDGATWKVENEIMKELKSAGYLVDYDNGHQTYGWNSLNGALVIRWAPRKVGSHK